MDYEKCLDLAEEHGTPLYVYDLGEIRSAVYDLRVALPDASELFYVATANPHPLINYELAKMGLGILVASTGELGVALDITSPNNILYMGHGQSEHEIDAALREHVGIFSIDSMYQLARIDAVSTRIQTSVDVLIRINPSDRRQGGRIVSHGKSSPFGIDSASLLENERALQTGPFTHVKGFHIPIANNAHMLGQIVQHFKTAIDTAVELSQRLKVELDVLDLGGGFGAPYATPGPRPEWPELASALSALLDDAFDQWRQGKPKLIFESGRYLVATAGALVSAIEDVKRSHDRQWLIMDSGINHLGGMGALHRIPRSNAGFWATGGEKLSANSEPVDIVGPLATSADWWTRGTRAPELLIGDKLLVPNVGAYGLTSSLLGLASRPCPKEIVVDGLTVKSISRLSMSRHSEP